MEDFSVPEEFEEHSKALYKKDDISPIEFVDFCLLAINLVDSNWDKRQGLAYHVAGAWVKYKNVNVNDILDQIGAEFGILELPDAQIANTEEKVRHKWEDVKNLVAKADKKFREPSK